ncbi:MAG: rhodanese-like domain-containing protein [Tenuifilaceae bacterium]
MDNFFLGFGNNINGIIHLSPKEALQLCNNGAILLDVRPEIMASYKSFKVPEYIFCYHQEIPIYFSNLPKDRPIIVADAVGIRSKEIVQFLIDNGFKLVANLVGGITDWEKDGLPMIIDNSQQLTGSCMCQLRTWGKNRVK